MNKLPSALILLFFSTISIAQEKEELSILKADTTWTKEIIKFPIDWAPEMKVKGFEELRFSKGWSNKESDTFWSLVIAWSIETDKPLTTEYIESNFNAYFNGLMKPNHWATEFPEPNTLFVKQETSDKSDISIGRMRLFDGFHTGKIIVINIISQQFFCKSTGKTIIVFRISPQDFEHLVWENLKSVTIKPNICD